MPVMLTMITIRYRMEMIIVRYCTIQRRLTEMEMGLVMSVIHVRMMPLIPALFAPDLRTYTVNIFRSAAWRSALGRDGVSWAPVSSSIRGLISPGVRWHCRCGMPVARRMPCVWGLVSPFVSQEGPCSAMFVQQIWDFMMMTGSGLLAAFYRT